MSKKAATPKKATPSKTSKTAPKTPPVKKTTKTPSPAKKAAKSDAKKPTKKVEKKVKEFDPSHLNDREIRILKALAKAPNGLNRPKLKERSGIASGLGKIVGTPTETVKPHTLEGRGLVRHEVREEERGMIFVITAKGRKLYESATAKPVKATS